MWWYPDTDGAVDGSFGTTWYVDAQYAGASLRLTATGQSSGEVAAHDFTDAPRVGTVTVAAQSGTLTYGTAGSATFAVTVNRGSGPGSAGAFTATLSITTALPTGATSSFPATVSFAANESSKTSTLTISTSAATPAGSYAFTVRAANTGADFATSTGTLTIGPRSITGSFTASDKVYDRTNAATIVTRSLSGALAGDAANVSLVGGTATFSDKNVANGKTVRATGLTLSGTDSGNYTVNTTATTTATITTAPTTATLTATSSVQYSDQATFTVTLSPAAISSSVPATGVQFKIDGVNIGGVQTLSVSGGQLTASLTTPIFAAPGNRTISAVFTGTNSNFAVASPATQTLTVTQEDARAAHTGLTYVTTASATTSTATVVLTATIQDITAVDAASDAYAGDIRNAKVTFINRDTGVAIATGVAVVLVNSADTRTGTATYSWTPNIGTADAKQYTIGVIVTDYYTRDNSADNTVGTVMKPTAGSLGGGGLIVNSGSTGTYAGDAGLKTNFGLNVKYNKSGTNLQGNVNIIVRSQGRVYQIKSNSITSLSQTQLANNGGALATFNSKATLADITNPTSPIALGGNLNLQIQALDKGEPGSNDQIAATLYDGTTLLFSTGGQKALAGGNIQVRQALLLAGAAGAADASLNESQLPPLIAAARAAWQDAGFDTSALDAVSFRLDDLPDGELGYQTAAAAGASLITLDRDAAGHGWFVDPTPWDDSEFAPGLADSPAHGRVDLLTVLAHEMGHALGFDHDAGDEVMDEALAVGERHLPAPAALSPAAPPAAVPAAPLSHPAPSRRADDGLAVFLAGQSGGAAAPARWAGATAEPAWVLPPAPPARSAGAITIGTPAVKPAGRPGSPPSMACSPRRTPSTRR